MLFKAANAMGLEFDRSAILDEGIDKIAGQLVYRRAARLLK